MINIEIESSSKKWLVEKNIEKFIEETCKKLIPLTDLKKILKKNFILEISISLVSDAQIKKINSEFRDKNKPTDVLSFSNLDEKIIRNKGIVKAVGDLKYLFLGDIVLSYETIKKDSLAQKKNFRNHMTHLILHSILHLIGFDHEETEMAKKMERLEIQILKKFKIRNPYQSIKS
jgi:probable rRNA maturation factor